MSFQQINEFCYYYDGPVNIGYIHKGSVGLLVDAGIDRSAIKKVLKELKKRELPLTHLFITHAHADHYGGAAYVQEHNTVYTIAPSFEEAILQYPKLEPLYLFGGNDPVDELQNKFLQGPSVRIDQVIEEGKMEIDSLVIDTILLPGHSYHQLAVLAEGILFAADSYFSEDTLTKHKIPYITDADQTIASIDRILGLECEGYVPGHGVFESDATSTIEKNKAYHQQLLDWLYQHIQQCEKGITHEQVIADMCSNYHVQAPQLSQWLLYRTAVTAYLMALKKQNKLRDEIRDHRWVFYTEAVKNP